MVDITGNETAGVQVIGQECRQLAAVIVQPAQQMTGIVGKGTHLACRYIQQMAGGIGAVCNSSANLVTALDQLDQQGSVVIGSEVSILGILSASNRIGRYLFLRHRIY